MWAVGDNSKHVTVEIRTCGIYRYLSGCRDYYPSDSMVAYTSQASVKNAKAVVTLGMDFVQVTQTRDKLQNSRLLRLYSMGLGGPYI